MADHNANKNQREISEDTDHFEEMDLSENGNLTNHVDFYCNRKNFNFKNGLEERNKQNPANN